MLSIDRLQLNNFRNLLKINLDLSTKFNIFHGENASGKTSLVESIYYLALGRSFRTNLASNLITHNTDSFTIFIELNDGKEKKPIGVERWKSNKQQIKVNCESKTRLSAITKILPIQFISSYSYRFFYEGPKTRRKFLDWATFHVEPSFFNLWQRLQRSLHQRNNALRRQIPIKQIDVWSEQVIDLSEEIDLLRHNTIEKLKPILNEQLQLLLPNVPLRLQYSRGWSSEKKLRDVLEQNLRLDIKLGYTKYGPQRADIQLLTEKQFAAKDVLSQGQQKLAAYGLQLAQGLLLKQENNQGPIYLIDDLPSELDQKRQSYVISALEKIDSQVFITGIHQSDLNHIHNSKFSKMFHVEQGSISNKKKG